MLDDFLYNINLELQSVINTTMLIVNQLIFAQNLHCLCNLICRNRIDVF